MSRSGGQLKNLQWFLLVAGIPFLIFGILSFRQISEWGETWKRRKAMVESGALTPLEATVAKKWEKSSEDGSDFMLSLKVPGEMKTISEEVGKRDAWKAMRIGQTIKVYPVDGEYFIPTLHTGGHDWGRWVFFGFGATPMTLGALLLIGRVFWTRPSKPIQAIV